MITIPTHETAPEPSGAPFHIDQCPFHYGQGINPADSDLPDDRIYNWPMVYILANKTSAYVGQTTSIASRMSQHGANEEKKDFDTANIIYNEEFNASVITGYEHELIEYMHADGKYRLTNKNNGMTDSNYFGKSEYAKMFNDLWEQLRSMDLADRTLSEIEESEVFKYSPFKRLTIDQSIALDEILFAIENGLDKAQPIVVQGMPGTGKTILAIYLLKRLKDDPRYAGMNIKIVQPITSLRTTLQHTLSSVSGLKPSDVIAPADLCKPKYGYRPGEKSFDIVLVDEAHKLKRRVNLGTQYGNFDTVNEKLGLPQGSSQLDWILDQAKLPIFFYDPLQNIGPSCVEKATVEQVLEPTLNPPIQLQTQMRVQGGHEYLQYIQGLLNGTCDEPQQFDNYDFVLHEDFADFVQSFNTTLERHNLSRMVAGYAWKWKTKKDKRPNAFDIEIDDIKLRWNNTYNNWVIRGVDNDAIAHEVGCVHSIQGYDLSYTYTIIGADCIYDASTGSVVANKSSYYDRNGWATASPEELTQYIKNIYYVLLTRGILGTHIYVVDPALREYLKRYIPSHGGKNHSSAITLR